MRPPTFPDLIGSPLLRYNAIEMTLTDCGAHPDCFDCQFFELGPDAEGGEHCALECAALIGNATPELARLFGWVERGDEAGWFDPPARCPWFAAKTDVPVPFDDPAQTSFSLGAA